MEHKEHKALVDLEQMVHKELQVQTEHKELLEQAHKEQLVQTELKV
jgi:hypothetical protein